MTYPVPGRQALARDVQFWGADLDGDSLLEPSVEEAIVVSTGTPDPHWWRDEAGGERLSPQTFAPCLFSPSSGGLDFGAVPLVDRERTADLQVRVDIRRPVSVAPNRTGGVLADASDSTWDVFELTSDDVERALTDGQFETPELAFALGHLYDAEDRSLARQRPPMVVSTADAIPAPSEVGRPPTPSVETLQNAGGLSGVLSGTVLVEYTRPVTALANPYTVFARMVRMSVSWRQWMRQRGLAR